MSNDEYLQWQGLLYKVAKRYVGINGLYDLEDLVQIGAIGLAKGLKTYENESDIPIMNYLANNISWTIYKEINKKKSIQNTISIYTPIGDEEEGTILEDILQDDNVDIEAEIENRLMVQVYRNEIEKYLDKDKSNICILRWLDDMEYDYITKVTGVNNISGILRESRIQLIRKSILFRFEYCRIHHINDFSNPAATII